MTEIKKKSPASPKTTPVKKAAPVKKVATKKAVAKKAAVTDSNNEVRYKIIQETAYLLAERDSFSGDPLSYWLEAEKIISNKAST